MKRSQTVIFLALVLWGGIFFMTACDGGNGEEDGDQTPTPSAPNAPTIEDIYAENRELAVLWDMVNNADTYNLYWNSTGGVTTSDTSVTGLLTPYYVHTGLSLFKTYSYAVTAVNAGGESGLSNEMSALAAGLPEELWKKLAADAQDSDNLGTSVAVSGDFAVAGAPGRDEGGNNRGAAYVFERNYGGNDNWGEVAKLLPSDPENFAYFGASVAIDGDYVVVGANSKDGGVLADTGAAYVFHRNSPSAGAWGEVAKLTASDAEAGDEFGISVAISGDYVVVGAYLEDDIAAVNRGAAYVFDRNSPSADSWGQVAKLTAPVAGIGDQFGISVSISGDNVVVGAHYEDDAGTDYGAAYVFDRNSPAANSWGQVKKLTAGLDVENAAYFGASVAINGDFVLVGARGEDGGAGTNRGAAYVFDRNSPSADSWGRVAKLTASDDEDGDEFGASVAIDGDYAIVGAYYEDGEGTSRGAAYIYFRNQGLTDSWGEVMKLTASDAGDQDWFGYSVAISGDYAVVGSPNYEGSAGNDRGAVYIF